MSWNDSLSREEISAVEEFRLRTIKDVTPKMIEDDTLFHRFMIARNFNLQNAETMLRKHLAWRKELQVDTIVKDFKPNDNLSKYFVDSLIGHDKEGCPIRFVDIGGFDIKGFISSFKLKDIVKCSIQMTETNMELLKKRNTEMGKSAYQIVFIYDWNKTTFATFTNKPFVNYVLHFANLYQDNYPERIKYAIHINVPRYFSILFSIVKPVLAPQHLEKFKIFGSDGWKEALLELIDADVLPSFLGGTRTDPDGNPLCKTIITFGEPIPGNLYRRKSEKKLHLSQGVKRVRIATFAKSEIVLEVNEPDSLLEWEFETSSKDIQFGVYFQRIGEESAAIPLLPNQRIDTNYEPETGIYTCVETGTYTIIFDNSYSWFHSKEIFYRARIIGPNDEKNAEWT